MSQAGSASSQTMQFVERARNEVNVLKAMVAQHGQTDGDSEGGAQLRSYMKRIATAESVLQKAETAIKRVKHAGHTAPRPPPPVPESERAARALAVLSGAGPASRLFAPIRGAEIGCPPLREEEIPTLCKRASQGAKIGVGPLNGSQGVGVGFLCENVFRAYLWFKEVPERGMIRRGEKSRGSGIVAPEHISVFGIDENSASRWSASKHAVFGVLTERANAAVRYFWARERSGADAFVALAEWLALHRSMFSDKCEDRRLAFDASRGFFLPACVRSFDGVGGPRFTRGSIPVRTSSATQYGRAQSGSGSGSQANAGASNATAQGSTAGHGNNGSSRRNG